MAKLLEKHNDNVPEPFPDDNLAHTTPTKWAQRNGIELTGHYTTEFGGGWEFSLGDHFCILLSHR